MHQERPIQNDRCTKCLARFRPAYMTIRGVTSIEPNQINPWDCCATTHSGHNSTHLSTLQLPQADRLLQPLMYGSHRWRLLLGLYSACSLWQVTVLRIPLPPAHAAGACMHQLQTKHLPRRRKNGHPPKLCRTGCQLVSGSWANTAQDQPHLAHGHAYSG